MTGEFGPRLRRERERRKISLESISANTKVSISLFHALERDDVSRWPCGIFRRSFVRSYAEALGLDADEIVREFVERFPDPGDTARAETAGAAPAETRHFRPRPPSLRLTLADHLDSVLRRRAPVRDRAPVCRRCRRRCHHGPCGGRPLPHPWVLLDPADHLHGLLLLGGHSPARELSGRLPAGPGRPSRSTRSRFTAPPVRPPRSDSGAPRRLPSRRVGSPAASPRPALNSNLHPPLRRRAYVASLDSYRRVRPAGC